MIIIINHHHSSSCKLLLHMNPTSDSCLPAEFSIMLNLRNNALMLPINSTFGDPSAIQHSRRELRALLPTIPTSSMSSVNLLPAHTSFDPIFQNRLQLISSNVLLRGHPSFAMCPPSALLSAIPLSKVSSSSKLLLWSTLLIFALHTINYSNWKILLAHSSSSHVPLMLLLTVLLSMLSTRFLPSSTTTIFQNSIHYCFHLVLLILCLLSKNPRTNHWNVQLLVLLILSRWKSNKILNWPKF